MAKILGREIDPASMADLHQAVAEFTEESRVIYSFEFPHRNFLPVMRKRALRGFYSKHKHGPAEDILAQKLEHRSAATSIQLRPSGLVQFRLPEEGGSQSDVKIRESVVSNGIGLDNLNKYGLRFTPVSELDVLVPTDVFEFLEDIGATCNPRNNPPNVDVAWTTLDHPNIHDSSVVRPKDALKHHIQRSVPEVTAGPLTIIEY